MPLTQPQIASPTNGHATVRILAYHAVRENSSGVACPVVSRARLRRQLQLLRWLGFSFISLEDWLNYLQRGSPVPRRAVVVTFDDGYEEMAGAVTQLLGQRRIPATLFVVSSLLGDSNRWDLPAGKPLKLLGPEALCNLAPAISIGSHSRSHSSLTQHDPETLREELSSSKKELERILGVPVRYVAYPYGDYNEGIGEAARDAGYQLGLGVQAGVNDSGSDRFHLRRICILSHDTLPRFFGKVVSPRTWLVLAGARTALRRGWRAAINSLAPARLWKAAFARFLTRPSS